MEEKYTDFAFLKENTFGNVRTMRELLSIYVHTTQQMLEEIAEGLAAERWVEVGKVIHKLKSNLNTVGANQAFDRLERMEDQLKAEDYDTVLLEAKALKDILLKVGKEIEEEIERLDNL